MGAFHGLFLILDRLFLLKILEKIGKVPSVLFTFFVVAMAWVLFRIENWNDALTFYKQLFDYKDIKFIELNNSFILIFLIAIFFSLFGRSKIGSKAAAFLMAQQQEQIPLFDVQTWFMQMKPKAPYPLFPKTGIHWSSYRIVS